MPYNPEKHHRHSIRLKNYDYSSQGAYFITMVTQNREHIFVNLINGSMHLNKYGNIAKRCWLDIPNHFPNKQIDEFIIMPNQVHGIIFILENLETDSKNINVGAIQELPQQENEFRENGVIHVGAIIYNFSYTLILYSFSFVNIRKNLKKLYFVKKKIFMKPLHGKF